MWFRTGNLAGEGQHACQVLSANGVVPPLGRLLLRGSSEHAAGAAQAAACAAWALANILLSCPSEVCSLDGLSRYKCVVCTHPLKVSY